jgi:hypothetical protein
MVKPAPVPPAKPRRRPPAFSMVALAIVLIVVGLILGFLLIGYGAFEDSRVKATVAEIRGMTDNTLAFYDQYEGFPGDINRAHSSVPGCNQANYCVSGNGDGRLGTPITRAQDVDATSGISENMQFWKQLALAGYVSGVQTAASADPAYAAFGVTHPAAQLGGGWNAVMMAEEAHKPMIPGVVFVPTILPNKTGKAALRPALAQALDTALDDGRPMSGRITAESVDSGCVNEENNTYITASDALICRIYIDATNEFSK